MLGELAFSEGHHHQVFLLICRNEIGAVQNEEGPIRYMRRSFVAIQEGMIASEAVGEGCRKIGDVRSRSAVCVQLLRPCQGRFEQGFVAYAVRSAVFRDLALVNGQDKRLSIQTIIDVRSLCQFA